MNYLKETHQFEGNIRVYPYQSRSHVSIRQSFFEDYSPVPLSDFYNTYQIGDVSFLTVVTMILQIKEVQPRVRESALKCLFYLNSLKNEKKKKQQQQQ